MAAAVALQRMGLGFASLKPKGKSVKQMKRMKKMGVFTFITVKHGPLHVATNTVV
jgi:hypothetical protein